MPRMTVPLLGGESRNRAIQVSNQESVNFYPVINGTSAKSQVALHSVPGLSLLATASSGGARSRGVLFKGWLYFVVGQFLVQHDGGSTVTLVGALSSTEGRVSMVRGRDYLMLVDGLFGYTWDGSSFAAISGADFPGRSANPGPAPTHCAYIDGYFVVNRPGTDEFHVSDNENPQSWPGDFANAESNPDDLLAVTSTEKILWLFGSETIEAYYTVADIDFPLAPYQSGTIEVGILAPNSLVQAHDGIYFLGHAKEGGQAVMKVVGLEVTAVDHDDIGWQLGELSRIDDCYAFIYRQRRKSFYVMQFPSAEKTFVLDLESGFWHTRASQNETMWRVGGTGYINNRVIAGDRRTGALYLLDYDVYDENGDNIIRTRRSQVVHERNLMLAHHELTLEVKSGVGLTRTPESTTELITNGTFTTDLTGWTTSSGSPAQSSGELQLANFGSNTEGVYQAVTVVSGQAYQMTFDIQSMTTSDSLRVNVGTTAGGSEVTTATYTSTGSNTLSFTPTTATIYVDFTGSADDLDAFTIAVDNISILGPTYPVDVDPQMQMRYSDDHGETWSWWLNASMGKIGEYRKRLQWNALGDSPHRIYEFRTAAKVEVTISNAYLDVEALAA